jgi:TRAP-type mannitol/chloroaromatic compound transport system permease small subunit
MRALLRLSRVIDWFNAQFGRFAGWMIVLSCAVSAVNAMVRYAFGVSSNAFLEAQWYMFAAAVMLGASLTLQRNEHIRVDIVYLHYSETAKHWVEILGTLFFLLPMCLLMTWLSWPFFYESFLIGEMSNNAGGLIRWPVKFLVPCGFALLAVQGVSQIIKRVAALRGYIVVDSRYERPTQ